MNSILIQTSIGDYRQAFIDSLTGQLGDSFSIVCGKEYFYPSLKTGVNSPKVSVEARNIFFWGRRLLLQLGVHRRAISAKSAVLEYNPRIINTWTVALIRRLLGKRTVLWGHVYSRKGKDSLLRYLLRGLSTGLIVYTEEQKSMLLNQLRYRGEAFAAPNALYSELEMQPVEGALRTSFLYVGRLVPDKKPLLMVTAFAKAIPELNPQAKLLIVGDGPERKALEQQILELQLGDRVQLLGHVSDYHTLRNCYSSALASLSPGYVGLSITQSLGFGVPMIFSRTEPHAPEICAAKEKWNSVSFETDSDQDLAAKMIEFSRDRGDWLLRAKAISEDCRRQFSVEKMVSEFITAVHGHEQ